MKSQMTLLGKLLTDVSNWCSTSTTRDLETITRRVEHEGFSFLTMTLPTFCQDFERSLDEGRIASNSFLSFKKRDALPLFLGGLLRQVFDSRTGVLLDNPSSISIFCIRQICLMHKKVKLECSNARVLNAYRAFVKTNDDVLDWETSNDSFFSFENDGSPKSSDARAVRILPDQFESFRKVTSLLWRGLLSDEKISSGTLVPKHGPGATAERISGNHKYEQVRWHLRLEPYFPSDLFLIPSWNYFEDLSKVDFVGPEDELPCRVVHVPKTLKTPRIIAIEPVCMQYTQQSLMEYLVPLLERTDWLSEAIGFTDQTVNQDLALSASKDRRLATIDLKDASDRVSNRLVMEMLADTPFLRKAVQACRSTRADVPMLGTIPIHRFASMGSALCFPIEAMVFYSIIVSSIIRSRGRQVSLDLIQEISKDVRVYGDDIIVPVEYVQIVKSELEWFNLRVNANKSFDTGKFRESCGMDAYDGEPVTPVYLRNLLPTSRRDTELMLSTISFRNQLYKAGFWTTCKYLDNLLGTLIPFPVVAETSAIKGRFSFLGYQKGKRWDSKLHNWLVKGHVVKSQPRPSSLDGIGALMKFFLKRGFEPSHDERHLMYSGRPVAVYTKQQWALPY